MALYYASAKILATSESKGISVRNLLYDSDFKNKPALTALTSQTIKCESVITELLEIADVKPSPQLPVHLLRVLTYEFLFGKGLGGNTDGFLRKQMRKNEKALKEVFRKWKTDQCLDGASKFEVLQKVAPSENEIVLPKYVRVNLVKTTVAEVQDHFIQNGFVCKLTREDADKMLENKNAKEISSLMMEYITNLSDGEFVADLHLPDLLVFAPFTNFYNNALYKDGGIILMDKSSCFAAHALSPSHDSHVVDACSSPGNKTSHIAALLNNSGRIFAFELDAHRIKVLHSQLNHLGVTNTTAKHQDFLKVDPNDAQYSQVKYILVDPSCTGSGILSRADYRKPQDPEKLKIRLASLQALQRKLLYHALSFPHVTRVVYSTCSIHQKENEEVVRMALLKHKEFKLKKVCESWNHKGVLLQNDMNRGGEEEGATEGSKGTGGNIERMIHKKCLRASPEEDRTNGFFIALFERKEQEEGVSTMDGTPVLDISANGEGDWDGDETVDERVLSGTVELDLNKRKSKKKKKREKALEQFDGDMVDVDANNVDKVRSVIPGDGERKHPISPRKGKTGKKGETFSEEEVILLDGPEGHEDEPEEEQLAKNKKKKKKQKSDADLTELIDVEEESLGKKEDNERKQVFVEEAESREDKALIRVDEEKIAGQETCSEKKNKSKKKKRKDDEDEVIIIDPMPQNASNEAASDVSMETEVASKEKKKRKRKSDNQIPEGETEVQGMSENASQGSGRKWKKKKIRTDS